MVKVIVNKNQYKLTVPKDFALMHGWRAGTELVFFEDTNGNVRVKEVKKA